MRIRRNVTSMLVIALACTLLSGCFGRSSSARTGSIVGTVTNANSGNPLIGATVIAVGHPPTATNSNGDFSLSGMPVGEVTLEVSCLGYIQHQTTVVVRAGGTTCCTIQLKPIPEGSAAVRGCATVANNYSPGAIPSAGGSRAKSSSRAFSVFQQDFSGSRPIFSADANTIQVKAKPGMDHAELSNELLQAGYEIVGELPLTGIILVRPMAQTEDFFIQSRASSLDSVPGIDWTYPDYPVYATAVPTDPLYPHQWHYSAISLPEAWDIATGLERPVIVAVIDTGIRPEHEDLQNKMIAGWDFIDNDSDPTDWPSATKNYSHGTHVSGTVAAATNNGLGVAGVSWGAQIMPIRVLGPDGKGSSSNVAEAIMWAVDNGADVINMSLGLANYPGPAMQGAVQYAYSRGVTMVAAAGNDSGAPVLYPAAFPEVIAVSATGYDNELADYSNYGPEITVAAPGGTLLFPVLSTGYSIAEPAPNKYVFSVGTSMATPHVSGIAALIISAHGRMSPASIEELISDTSMDLGPDGHDSLFGAGIVNAYAALTRATIDRAVFAIKDSSGKWISESVHGKRDRTFTIPLAPAGDHVLVGFLDIDGDGEVSAGDFYGEMPITVPPSGVLWAPRLVMNYVDGTVDATGISLSSPLSAKS